MHVRLGRRSSITGTIASEDKCNEGIRKKSESKLPERAKTEDQI